jgi:uncharacterized repeat protein (TIGR01451 family)
MPKTQEPAPECVIGIRLTAEPIDSSITFASRKRVHNTTYQGGWTHPRSLHEGRREMHVRFSAATVTALALLALVPGAAASESTQTAAPAGTPTYASYSAPAAFGNNAGEPSIGVDWKTGNVFFQSNTSTYRVSFDDCSSPARATWEERSAPTSVTTLDPILFCDHNTGSHPNRVFASQLAGTTSLMSFSDDDGETWHPSQGGGIASGVDHQTVGGGPFHAPLTRDPAGSDYPNAVYYCSQDVADAACAVSLDGGQTFGPAVPIWTIAECGGLHGHVKVAPNDGTAYVPEKACPSTLVSPNPAPGHAAVAVSETNGATWNVRPVTTSTRGDTDPSVGIANDGTVYFGYDAADDHARIAVSHDHGQTWEHDTDVGAPVGVVATEFPEVVAGDGDRAAFAFLGATSPTPATNPATTSTQIWHLYIASTFDGGQTWTTVDATPSDPVQRGWICVSGTTCSGNRNLLDFNDLTVDAQGRVLAAYADGCIGSCVSGGPNSFTAKGVIVRQTGGKRLFAQFDPPATSLPGPPRVDAVRDDRVIHLSWAASDGGSAITSYHVARSTSAATGFTSVATVTDAAYDDFNTESATAYYYRVTAVNGLGEGSYCQIQVNPGVTQTESACRTPGVTIYDDNTGDAVDQIAGHDVQKMSVAEPYLGQGVSKLVFTLKVRSLASVPPNTTWPIGFTDQKGGARCVAMWSDAASNVSFVFGGSASCAQSPTAVVTPLDSASNYNADGTITLVLPDSALGISPGQTLTNFITRVRAESQAGSAITPDNMPDGVQAGQQFTLVGNAACAPNNRPTARLTATPSSGFAPLSTTLDGSASSDSDGDAISSYTFDFGDGSPLVTQTTSSVSHTYASPGVYHATLTVKDGRGLDSGNVASVDIAATTSADISVTNADAPDPIKKDKQLTYTITVRNDGPYAATGVTLTDPLAARVELASAKTTQGSCKPAKAGQVVTVSCSLGSLAPGSSATVTIVAKRLQAGTLTNTATGRAASPGDPNPANNSATATTTATG